MRALLAVLFLSACAGRIGHVHLDTRTLPPDLDRIEAIVAVERALIRWEECGVYPAATISFRSNEYLLGAVGRGRPGVIYLNIGYGWATSSEGCNAQYMLEHVAAHELGHAAGFDHTDDPNDVMFHQVHFCEIKPIVHNCSTEE
jgi:hypothetical protein